MKNRGFIATSLIYSFFLVFIAILAALLNNYVANKTILDRFNEDTQDELNTKTYTVNVYGVNANIQTGMTLTNLIANGTFINQDYWDQVGNMFNYNIPWGAKISLHKTTNSTNRTYLSQNIHVLNDTKYYYSINYINPDSSNIARTYISKMSSTPEPLCLGNDCYIGSVNNGEDWTRESKIFNSNENATYRFIVGDNTNSFNKEVRFTEAMVINLTSSFGIGYEPDVKWMDKNIDYFDKTISFKTVSGIEKGGSITVKFVLFENYTNYDIKCTREDTGATRTIGSEDIKVVEDDDRKYAIVKIDGVESNLKCKANWSSII